MFPQNLKAHDNCFYSFQNVSNVVLIAMFPSSGIFVSPCHVFEAVNRLFRLLIKSEIFRYFLQLCTAKNRWAIASSVPFSINISPLDVNYVDISRHHLHWVTTSWLWRISHRDLSQSQTEENFEWIIKVRKSALFNRWEKKYSNLSLKCI